MSHANKPYMPQNDPEGYPRLSKQDSAELGKRAKELRLFVDGLIKKYFTPDAVGLDCYAKDYEQLIRLNDSIGYITD